MAATPGDFVTPGDVILIERSDEATAVLGPGLRSENGVVYATVSGLLKKKDKCPNYWVESRRKRYVAAKGDKVIGVATTKMGDNYLVDIGASDQALLSYLSFEGSTKRNRPDIEVGDLVYGRLMTDNQTIEITMSCIDSKNMSSGMGLIKEGGFLMKLPVYFARRLSSSGPGLIVDIAGTLAYEIVIGDNGWIWIKGGSTKETLALVHAFTEAVDKPHCTESTRTTN